mgnify:CR=1 FL=1
MSRRDRSGTSHRGDGWKAATGPCDLLEQHHSAAERGKCRGRKTVNVDPAPNSVATRTRPPWLSTMAFTVASPRPCPS